MKAATWAKATAEKLDELVADSTDANQAAKMVFLEASKTVAWKAAM